jgi:hypothetical protein
MSDKLKCPICNEYFDAEDIDLVEQYESIIKNGRCINCLEDIEKDSIIYKSTPQNGWQSVEYYKNMWGELHPTTYDKLLELSREDLRDIALSAMSAMASPQDITKTVKRIKKYL